MVSNTNQDGCFLVSCNNTKSLVDELDITWSYINKLIDAMWQIFNKTVEATSYDFITSMVLRLT